MKPIDPWQPKSVCMPESVPLSVIILCRDEEANIERAISSCGFAQQIVVVDSGSSDRSPDIARRLGVEVVSMKWHGFGAQRERALRLSEVTHDWVLWVDADEYVSDALAAEISLLDFASSRFVAFRVPMRVVFQGKLIRHSGWSTTKKTILLNRDRARYASHHVSEHPDVNGPLGELLNPIVDDDRKGFGTWLEKHVQYARLEATSRTTAKRGKRLHREESRRFSFTNDSRPRSRALARKALAWDIPLKSFFLFAYLFFFRLGFLDGKWGFRLCLYQALHQKTISIMEEQIAGGKKP